MKNLCALLITVTTCSALANERNGVYIGTILSHGKMDIVSNLYDEHDKVSGAGIGVNLGYLFDSNILTQVGVSTLQNFTLAGAVDGYSLWQTNALIGYKLSWQNWSVVPKAGIAHTSLNAKEGALFNPGEEMTKNQSDKHFVWSGALAYAVSSDLELALSHEKIDTDFGGYSIYVLELNVDL